MRISKKITALFIAVMMVVSAIPFTASAESDPDPYLTFTGTESFSINTYNNQKNWDGTLQYSTNASTWTTWDGTSEISSVNDVLYLRGKNNTQITGSNDTSTCWVITTEGTVACSGDIRTLLNYANPASSSMGANCFSNLFKDWTSLTAAPELPATILAEQCYANMFFGCTSLTTAPDLSATTLANYCCSNMFKGCISLTTAPELPATTLANYCYTNMFNGCRSLTTAPELPATMLAEQCYNSMFYGCESLTTAPVLPATTLANYCYYNMFRGCRSLITAPELWATTTEEGCYGNMFNGCTSLTTPSDLWASDLAGWCYNGMFQGCTGIKLSTEQTAEYSIPYSIPKEGTAESVGKNALANMFTGTGGTFTGTPSINTTYYLAAPAPAVNYVAEINGTGYETVEEAITAAQNGDTVTLLSDVSTNITVPAGKNITLDLGDKTVNKPIINNGTLTITNGTLYNPGFYMPDIGYGAYAVMNNGVLTVEDVTCTGTIVNKSTVATPSMTINSGTYHGDFLAVASHSGATTEINGGTFDGQGFVEACSGSKIVFNDGTVTAVLAYGNGGSLEINGGYINALVAENEGDTPASIVVTGGTFKDSTDVQQYMADGVEKVDNGDGTYTVLPASTPKPDGFNLSIEDMIHMNLYINVDDYEGDTVVITYNDPDAQTPTAKTDTYTGSALTELKDAQDGRYVISVLAAPAQIKDEVTVEVMKNGSVVHTFTTTVATYCNEIIAKSSDAELVALAKAMLDYGKACSDEFNYNEDAFVEQAYYNTADASYILDEEAKLNSADANGQFAGYAYIAKSVPALRIYLNTTEAEVVQNNLKAYVNGVEKEITVVEGTTNVCVDITGILAEDLNAEYTVEFNGGTLKLNALQYAKAKGGNTDLGRSMCRYWDSADYYFKR